MFESGTTTLIISNEEMNDIIKIVKSLEESALLIKGASETIQFEAKEQKGGYLSMLLATLGADLLMAQLQPVKAQLEQARIFNAVSSFKQF